MVNNCPVPHGNFVMLMKLLCETLIEGARIGKGPQKSLSCGRAHEIKADWGKSRTSKSASSRSIVGRDIHNLFDLRIWKPDTTVLMMHKSPRRR